MPARGAAIAAAIAGIVPAALFRAFFGQPCGLFAREFFLRTFLLLPYATFVTGGVRMHVHAWIQAAPAHLLSMRTAPASRCQGEDRGRNGMKTHGILTSLQYKLCGQDRSGSES